MTIKVVLHGSGTADEFTPPDAKTAIVGTSRTLRESLRFVFCKYFCAVLWVDGVRSAMCLVSDDNTIEWVNVKGQFND